MSRPILDRRPFCSACSTRIDGQPLTFETSAGPHTISVGAYCSTRCETIGRVLYALAEAPPGASAELRDRISATLAAAWRHGTGPDPTLVLTAVESAARSASLAA